jgi:hypothetical protein
MDAPNVVPEAWRSCKRILYGLGGLGPWSLLLSLTFSNDLWKIV